MKRFAVLLFALLTLLITLPVLAHADIVPKKTNVGWHRSVAANRFSSGDAVELEYSAATQRADTSQAIDMVEFLLPPAIGTTSAVGDSIGWLRIVFYPASSRTTVAADSIYLSLQVSDNSITWTDITPTRTFVAAGIGAHDALVVLENGATNQFYAAVRQAYAGTASGIFMPVVSSTTEPTWLQVYGHKFMRIIVQGDYTGHYDAELYGFKANNK